MLLLLKRANNGNETKCWGLNSNGCAKEGDTVFKKEEKERGVRKHRLHGLLRRGKTKHPI